MKIKVNTKTESFRMRISRTFQNKLKQTATKKGMNVSNYIRKLVEQDCQHEQK